jgi:hypothetical protein
LDSQSGTENLLHVLRGLENQPQVLNRKRFRATWTGNSEYWTGDLAFEQYPLARKPDPDEDHIDPAYIVADLARLNEFKRVLIYAQTHFAHRVPTEARAEIPTYRELHEAIEGVQEVIGRYYMLFGNPTPMSFEPEPQYNVYKAFEFSWIADRKHFDYRRCE